MLEAKCPDSESNQGHEDFQSSALPTENLDLESSITNIQSYMGVFRICVKLFT